ncbi:hypothetical protein GIB67_032148 [Kingdonia uniflora]|uniref:Uncharacterized protein n=1 Tax=Kingdonia uniflora TaxID=39325 RepID=A0A7J7MX28_9MAGN|nr:hypothetical protein GIB67_032148 [Kingdonia uniflora]
MYETKQVFAMQVLDLLRRSLLTMMPFSDVFLPYRCIGLLLRSKELTETVKPRKIRKPHPRNNMRLVLDMMTLKLMDMMTLKLMVSKSPNEVLNLEAGTDFEDFIFRILTLPLGSVIKILGGNTNMGCIDNSYKSTAKGYEVVNSKSPSLETASGGGFMNGQITYFVTDQLSVKPLSPIDALSLFTEFDVPIEDIEEQVVLFGKDEWSVFKSSELVFKAKRKSGSATLKERLLYKKIKYKQKAVTKLVPEKSEVFREIFDKPHAEDSVRLSSGKPDIKFFCEDKGSSLNLAFPSIDLNKVECYRCHMYGQYAHNYPTKSFNSNQKAMNITVTWDDSNDDTNDHDDPFLEGRNGLRAHIVKISSSCDHFDMFALETNGDDHKDYEIDNCVEPSLEELYSQLVSQLKKLKNEKQSLSVQLNTCEHDKLIAVEKFISLSYYCCLDNCSIDWVKIACITEYNLRRIGGLKFGLFTAGSVVGVLLVTIGVILLIAGLLDCGTAWVWWCGTLGLFLIASYYPWHAATFEGEFDEDGVPIEPELHTMVNDIAAQHNLYTGSGIVSRKMLDDEFRLVHSIAITNIIPRSQKNEHSERMKVFLYAFKNYIEIDLPNIIIEEMIDASTKTATRNSLPFALLVMEILTAASYKVFPNEPEDTKTKKLDASNCHKSVSHLPHVQPSEPTPPGEHIGSSSSAAQPQEVFSLQSIGACLRPYPWIWGW